MADRSPEVQREIADAVALVKELSKEDLQEELSGRGVTDLDAASKGWMKKKLRYALQQEILQRHGLEETPAMAEAQEAVDQDQTEAKPGRKRMTKTGTFKIDLGEGGSTGRDGSCKGKILKTLIALERSFTYAEFEEAVSQALDWNVSTETFGQNTRFPSLSAASNAWFSELKNKAKIISQDAAEAAA